MKSVINRVELLFIQLFRWLIFLVLTVILVFSAWFAAKGVLSLPGARLEPEPAKPPPGFVAPFDEWLADNRPKDFAPASPPAQVPEPAKSVDTSAATQYASHVSALWPLVAAYQKACNIANPLTKEQFVDSLRQTPLQRTLANLPSDYGSSQVGFVKQALENPETIKLCLSGKAGIFLSVLDFHLKQYNRHVFESKIFVDAERERLSRFALDQERARDRQFAEAQRILTLAAGTFGLFLGLMLLLIFTRIEVNLRAISTGRGLDLTAR